MTNGVFRLTEAMVAKGPIPAPGYTRINLHGGVGSGLFFDVKDPAPAIVQWLSDVYVRQAPGALDYFLQEPIVPPAPAGGIAPQAHYAWKELRRKVNRRLPMAYARSRRKRRALRHRIHRWRRVG